MRAQPLILSVLLVVGCGTPARNASEPLVEKTGPYVPAELAEANEALRKHIVDTQLTAIEPSLLAHEDVLRGMLRWKANRGRARTSAFEAVLTRNASVDLSEFALLRLSQHDLNLACETAGLPAPAHLSTPQQGIFSDMLIASAFRQMQVVHTLLDDAAGLAGPRHDRIVALRALLPVREGEVLAACARTSEAWAPGAPATLDDVAGNACREGEAPLCWVWGVAGNGGEKALELACEGEVVRACLALADRRVSFGATHSDPAETLRAEELYRKACGLGSELGCRQEVAVFVPSRQPEYRRACMDAGEAVACLKLARIAASSSPSSLWWQCSAQHEAEQQGPCEEGDALACIRRALAAPAAGSSSHVVNMRPFETSAELEQSVVACGESAKDACWQAANAFVEQDDLVCATVMLLEECARGETDACGLPPAK